MRLSANPTRLLHMNQKYEEEFSRMLEQEKRWKGIFICYAINGLKIASRSFCVALITVGFAKTQRMHYSLNG